jgi:hypothetical protein
MTDLKDRIEIVLKTLLEIPGVITVKALSRDEMSEILMIEKEEEEKIVFGMCKSINKGIREALGMEYTIGLVIKSSEFQHPHHPHMVMICGTEITGEIVSDVEKIQEMRKDTSNFFLWDNFVVYMKKLPKNPRERNKMRVVYEPRKPHFLQDLSFIQESVFGTLSIKGDTYLKKILSISSKDPMIGTGLVGLNIKK